MITQDEIDDAAGRFGLTIANVERDYVFGWVLAGIFQTPQLHDMLAVKGGNALRKAHLPATRFSDDLDFTTPGNLDPEVLLAGLNDVCRFVEARSGVEFDLARNRVEADRQIDRERQVFKGRLYFKDFAGERDHVRVSVRLDVTANDQLKLPLQTRRLIHPYSDSSECSIPIRVVQLEEVLADKLRCLIQRRYCNDLFDAVFGTFVASGVQVDRIELMRVFLSKTIFGRSPGAAKRLLHGVPFNLFRGYWEKVVCPIESRIGFDDAVSRFLGGLDDLFAPFSYGTVYEDTYFPPELRNPIIESGSKQQLIRMSYDGITRLVEPYALTFKFRKDGGAEEYFYGYDRTGGRTSGAGIKSFVARKVRSLEATDEAFQPRFTIELSKAGGAKTAERFQGRPGLRRLVGLPPRRSPTRPPRYIVECTYCERRYPRQRFSLALKPHKDKEGYACPGRWGRQVHF